MKWCRPHHPVTDRVCAHNSVCTASEFESKPPMATTKRECQATSTCGAGQRVATPATESADLVCGACGVGIYLPGFNRTQTITCEAQSVCGAGWSVSASRPGKRAQLAPRAGARPAPPPMCSSARKRRLRAPRASAGARRGHRPRPGRRGVPGLRGRPLQERHHGRDHVHGAADVRPRAVHGALPAQPRGRSAFPVPPGPFAPRSRTGPRRACPGRRATARAGSRPPRPPPRRTGHAAPPGTALPTSTRLSPPLTRAPANARPSPAAARTKRWRQPATARVTSSALRAPPGFTSPPPASASPSASRLLPRHRPRLP